MTDTHTLDANKTIPQPRLGKAQAESLLPTRRDLRFDLPVDKIRNWNRGPHTSHFMNTLSVLFPVGERFFIHSVRHYRDQITDPELKKAVTAFIGQEAMHGREHEDYNKALFDAVEGAEQEEIFTYHLLEAVKKALPKSMHLSATIALEHFTAIMADLLLKNPEIIEDADPAFAAVWTWHALEETEHKAVAYDVWSAVMGKSPAAYTQRAAGLLLATPILWAVVGYYYLRLLKKEGELTNIAGWKDFWRLNFGQIGFMRRMAKPWLDYFRPGFHPWDHDNRHFLKMLEDFPASVQNPS